MNSGRNLRFSIVDLWRARLGGWKRGRAAGRLGGRVDQRGANSRTSRWEVLARVKAFHQSPGSNQEPAHETLITGSPSDRFADVKRTA